MKIELELTPDQVEKIKTDLGVAEPGAPTGDLSSIVAFNMARRGTETVKLNLGEGIHRYRFTAPDIETGNVAIEWGGSPMSFLFNGKGVKFSIETASGFPVAGPISKAVGFNTKGKPTPHGDRKTFPTLTRGADYVLVIDVDKAKTVPVKFTAWGS